MYKVRYASLEFSQDGMLEDSIPLGHAVSLCKRFPTFRKTQYIQLQRSRGNDLMAATIDTSNVSGERNKRLGLKIAAIRYTETSVPIYRTT